MNMTDQELQLTRAYIKVREVRSFWRGWVIGAACMLIAWALSGCATTVRVEAEHISHPFAGWPVGPKDQEDGVSVANVLLEWGNASQGPYLDLGLGQNLQGADGGGFYGPSLTAVARAGYAWRIKP